MWFTLHRINYTTLICTITVCKENILKQFIVFIYIWCWKQFSRSINPGFFYSVNINRTLSHSTGESIKHRLTVEKTIAVFSSTY